MSPHIRSLLEEAADDEGRPVTVDLAAVKAAGRRAAWRQRAIVGGGALGAAAVITSVALVLAPGGGTSGVQPAGDGQSSPLDDALEPMITALRSSGYDVTPSPVTHAIAASGTSEEGAESSDSYLAAGAFSVVDGEMTGAAIAAEFTDVDLVTDAVLGAVDPPLSEEEVNGYEYTEQCAIIPGNSHRSDFAWDTCDKSDGGRTRVATGGDSYGDAIGVTLLRPDGSGVSLAVSTAAYDRPMDGGAPGAPALGELPLSAEELRALGEGMLADGPFLPPPDITVPPSTDPCSEEVPPGTECESEAVPEIDTDALVMALAALGLEATSMSESGGGASDGSQSAVHQFHLTDDQGRAGSAAIGVFSDLDTARASVKDGDAASWCAVAPAAPVPYEWSLAGADAEQPCTGVEATGEDQIIVFVHDEPGAEAIGATLVRADGSVVSVSVSREPSAFISSQPTALPEVPLNAPGIVDVLEQLAATT